MKCISNFMFITIFGRCFCVTGFTMLFEHQQASINFTEK